MTLSRRQLIVQGGAFGLGMFGPGMFGLGAVSSIAAPCEQGLSFAAFRDDSAFGHHTVRFTRGGQRLTVDIEIAFDVKLAFIPLYRYRHRNREVWEDGRLISLSTETDDNGTPYVVKAEARNGGLRVEGSSGRLDLPGDIMPTSYWSETIGRRGVWLDTQKGAVVRSSVTEEPTETIDLATGRIEAVPYRLEGDISCRLWYRDGCWVKLRFPASDGSVIDYLLEPVDGSA
jgi:hypothetical protein